MRTQLLGVATILFWAVSCSSSDGDAPTDPGTQDAGGSVDGSAVTDSGPGADGGQPGDAGADAPVEAGACAAQGKVTEVETYEVSGSARQAVAVSGGLVMMGNYSTTGVSTPAFGSVAAPATITSEPYLLKRADNGTEQWLARPRGAGAETALGVAADAAGDVYVVVTGTSASATLTAEPLTQNALGTLNPGDQPVYVVKLAGATGQAQWIAPIGGAQCSDIAAGSTTVAVKCRIGTGSLAFRTGAASTSSLTAFGDSDVTVLGLDPATGYVTWHSQLGIVRAAGLAADMGGAIAVAPNGDVVIAGSFRDGSVQDTLASPARKVDPLDPAATGYVGIANHTNGQVSALTAFGTNAAASPRFDTQGNLLLFGRYDTLTLGGVTAPASPGSFLAVVPNPATLTPTLLTTGPMAYVNDAINDSCGRYSMLGPTTQATWQGLSVLTGPSVVKIPVTGPPSWASSVAANDGTSFASVVAGVNGRTAIVGTVVGQKTIALAPTFGQNDGLSRPFVAVFGP